MLENGSTVCSCKKKKCIRHGNCNECIEYHKNSKWKPYCKTHKSGSLNKQLNK